MKDMDAVLSRQGNAASRAMAHHLKKEDGRRLLGGNEAMAGPYQLLPASSIQNRASPNVDIAHICINARYWFPTTM